MAVKILKGSILIHRVFDVGGEVNLSRAEKLLSEDSKRLNLTTDTRKAIIIKDAPLKVELGTGVMEISGAPLQVSTFARVWSYGVMSVSYTHLTLPTKRIV